MVNSQFSYIFTDVQPGEHTVYVGAVDSSHSLRDYFITHKIYSETVTPFELSQISRHSITTMMKYYKRDSELEQLRITKKLEETFKIKSKYQLENDEKNEDKND